VEKRLDFGSYWEHNTYIELIDGDCMKAKLTNEQIAKALIEKIRARAEVSLNSTDLHDVNSFTVGYLESFVTMLMNESPKVRKTIMFRADIKA